MINKKEEIAKLIDSRFSYTLAKKLVSYDHAEGVEFLKEFYERLLNTYRAVGNIDLNEQEWSRLHKVRDFLDLFKEEPNHYKLYKGLPWSTESLEVHYKTRLIAEEAFEEAVNSKKFIAVSLYKNGKCIKRYYSG